MRYEHGCINFVNVYILVLVHSSLHNFYIWSSTSGYEFSYKFKDMNLWILGHAAGAHCMTHFDLMILLVRTVWERSTDGLGANGDEFCSCFRNPLSESTFWAFSFCGKKVLRKKSPKSAHKYQWQKGCKTCQRRFPKRVKIRPRHIIV